MKTKPTALLLFFFFLVFQKESQAQDNLSKLSYPQIDSFVMLYYGQGVYDKALIYTEEGMNRAKNDFGGEDSIYTEYLGNAGVLYDVLGNYPKAESILLESIKIKKKILGEQHKEYAIAISNLAVLYQKMGKIKEVEKLYLQSLDISLKTVGKKHPNYAKDLISLGYFYQEIGNYEKAEDLMLEAISIYKKANLIQEPNYATALNNLAFLYQMLGDYESATALFLQAIAIQKQVLGETHPDYANSLGNLALLYNKTSQYEQAEPLYLEAKNIYLNAFGKEHPNYGLTLNNLAFLYEDLGNYELSEKLYLEGLSIYKNTLGEKHNEYINILNNLASVYSELGKNEKVENLRLHVIDIYKSTIGETHPRYAIALNNLGFFYSRVGKNLLAEQFYLKGSNILKNALGETHAEYVNALSNLANLYKKTNQLDTALAYAMKSIALNSENFDALFPTLFEDKTVENYAIATFKAPVNPTDFLKLGELEVLSFSKMNIALNILLSIMTVQVEQKKITTEYLYNINKGAMKLYDKTRHDFSGTNNKLRILRENNLFVKSGIQNAFDLAKPEYYAEAFSFAEQNKSILLADAIKGSRAKTLSDLPDSIVLKEQDLEQKKDLVKKKKFEAKTPEDKSNALSEENELNREIDSFLKLIKSNYPKYHALKYDNITAKAEDVQVLLDEKTLMLSYFLSDKEVFLFAISKSSVELFSMPIGAKLLKSKIKFLRDALTDYGFILKNESKAFENYTESAHWFYKELLEVALLNKKIENLIIITDGELGHLPFEVFLSKPAPQKGHNYRPLDYLLNDYNISYNYSATLWKENKNIKEKENNNRMLAFAPSYNKNTDTLNLLSRSPYMNNIRKELPSLPAAKKEISTLEATFQGLFLQDEAANEGAFKTNAPQYSIIHLAMHGILHPNLPMLSSLAFTENNDSLNDNFLQAYEISHLKLNASLVVLSACETGYGHFEQGEGVISLARSFMYAGVPSLVVSLWQVNDGSTAIIMQSFYENLAEGMPKDLALRQAKLDYVKNAIGIAAHPAFWSAFIQLGDSQPIKITTKGTGLYWAIGFGLFLALTLIIVIVRRKYN